MVLYSERRMVVDNFVQLTEQLSTNSLISHNWQNQYREYGFYLILANALDRVTLFASRKQTTVL